MDSHNIEPQGSGARPYTAGGATPYPTYFHLISSLSKINQPEDWRCSFQVGCDFFFTKQVDGNGAQLSLEKQSCQKPGGSQCLSLRIAFRESCFIQVYIPLHGQPMANDWLTQQTRTRPKGTHKLQSFLKDQLKALL